MKKPAILFAFLALIAALAALRHDGMRSRFALFRRAGIRLEDWTARSGVAFRAWNGEKGISIIAEQIGPGCGVFDFDGDRRPDLYFVNGRDRYGRGIAARNALYRNLGAWKFEDVTQKAGVEGTGYGFGCVAADYDNDGFRDLYVTQWDRNALYRNNGDGTFAEVTDGAGVGGAEFGKDRLHTGAAFGDFNGDGSLDLYVCSYVRLASGPRYCQLFNRIKTNCPPSSYDGTPDILYLNRGDGSFVNVTRSSGVLKPNGKGLVTVWSDVTEDGHPDLFVANDGHEAYLFRNQGDGTFIESALELGVAFAEGGNTMSAMGTDFGDYDRDGRLDLLIADFQKVPNRLFQRTGQGFTEVSIPSGLGAATVNSLGFGAGFIDLDNDGWEDVFFANGHVYPEVDQAGGPERYRQRNQVFRNSADGSFKEVTLEAGSALSIRESSRGLAWGDLDDDGRVDLVVSNVNAPPTLLRNVSGRAGNYLLLELCGRNANRDALGARVEVLRQSRPQVRELRSGGSYLSHSEPQVHLGIGPLTGPVEVEVIWPRGKRSVHSVEAGRPVRLVEPTSE